MQTPEMEVVASMTPLFEAVRAQRKKAKYVPKNIPSDQIWVIARMVPIKGMNSGGYATFFTGFKHQKAQWNTMFQDAIKYSSLSPLSSALFALESSVTSENRPVHIRVYHLSDAGWVASGVYSVKFGPHKKLRK